MIERKIARRGRVATKEDGGWSMNQVGCNLPTLLVVIGGYPPAFKVFPKMRQSGDFFPFLIIFSNQFISMSFDWNVKGWAKMAGKVLKLSTLKRHVLSHLDRSAGRQLFGLKTNENTTDEDALRPAGV